MSFFKKFIFLILIIFLIFIIKESLIFNQDAQIRNICFRTMRSQNSSRVAQLRKTGVVPSYDYLGEELVSSGEILKLVQQHGIAKFTSNQSIFLKDLKSGVYDKRIRKLAKEGKKPEEIYDILYRGLVERTCNVLLYKYKKDPNNYFVSIETNPKNAYDTKKTLEEARKLNKIAPNEDTKIAATPEGIEAIEQAVAEGLDINVTLMFPGVRIESAERGYIFKAPQFGKVFEAVRKGYEKYYDKNSEVGFKDVPRVVLSVFLSRMDTKPGAVDEKLKQLKEDGKISEEEYDSLKGKTGMYAGKIIYQILKQKIETSPIFKKLKSQNISLPRLLFASTQPKKDYISPLQYVQPLQPPSYGLEIVNTLTPKTFEDFNKEGLAEAGTIQEDLDEAISHIKRLQELGIDLVDIAKDLVTKGVKSFEDAYEEAIGIIANKVKQNTP